ncbi:TPA: phage tail protein [Escherichia coli]|nr:phage tail protein [Escherichia coli]
MSALLTKAFEKWVAECTASNLPARPDAIIFALMEREPAREDNTVPEEKITYAVNELTYGQLSPNNIVCSAVVPDDCAFSYDWICLIHQASGTLCGVIKTPVQQKVTGESLIRNFTIIYSGIAQAAQITVPPQSWQVDLFPEINKKAPLDSPAFTGTPTTPTPPDDAVGLEMANAAFVRKLLAALVDSSPEALDTLNELAAALGNDPNFSATVINALAGKQPLNDLLTAISELTKRADNLLYFNQDGNVSLSPLSEKARALLALDTPEAMRTELELKAAATMEPQSDIRDRTPGRLALPGAFGFGYAFSQSERLNFNSDEKFLEWVKNATEGRYFIYSYNSKIFPDRDSFIGIVDVVLFPSGNSNGNPAETDKGLFFYSRYYSNSDQSVFYAQYSSAYADGVVTWGLTSVRNLSLTPKMLSEYLSSTAGAGTYFQYPGIGVPVLAVYRGTTSGDKEIKIGLGDVVAGSRLGAVNIKCAAPTGIGSYGSTPQVGATGYTFPGRYMALSGARDSYGNEARICLFVRIE